MTSVCVFLASATGHDPIYADAARDTGRAIAARGWRLVYGGAHRGLMGVLADACLDAGGQVIGVLPHILAARELAHPRLTQLELVDTMAQRKQRMDVLADAYLTLPGGFGTLDELFEVLTAAQLGVHRKPVALIDLAGYFTPLVAWIDGAVAAGLVAAEHRAMLRSYPTVDAAVAGVAARLLDGECDVSQISPSKI
jgi:uncharacterized protein (TIGR00730 family)